MFLCVVEFFFTYITYDVLQGFLAQRGYTFSQYGPTKTGK